jgi:flagellar motor switch protein FliG
MRIIFVCFLTIISFFSPSHLSGENFLALGEILDLPEEFFSGGLSPFVSQEDLMKDPDVISGVKEQYKGNRLSIPTVEENPQYWSQHEHITKQVYRLFTQDLKKYCQDQCFLSDIQPWLIQSYDTTHPDLGFESVNASNQNHYEVVQVDLTVLVNDRYGKSNLEKIAHLFDLQIERMPYPMHVSWKMIPFPSKDHVAWLKQSKQRFRAQVEQEAEKTLREFCGHNCLIQRLQLQYQEEKTEENETLLDFLVSPDGQTQLSLTRLRVDLTVNEELGYEEAERIGHLLTERLKRFYDAPELSLNLDPFPHRRSSIEQAPLANATPETQETLKILKILEDRGVIQPTPNTSETWSKAEVWALGGLAFVLLLLFLYFFVFSSWLKWNPKVQKALQEAETHLHQQQSLDPQTVSPQIINVKHQDSDHPRELPKPKLDDSILLQQLKDKVNLVFIEQPRVAKVVFGKMLSDGYLDQVAKYAMILGEIIVFELVNDTSLKDEIQALSEILSKSTQRLPESEQIVLLQELELKITGAKVRVLAKHGKANFDFITSKSPDQIYELIHDESPTVQSVILTQLDAEKRSGFFNYLEGPHKTKVLKELTGAVRFSHEYLNNLADALQRKASKRPEFSAESIQGLNVIQDLITNANYEYQKVLFNELDRNHPQTAKSMRSQIATIPVLTQLTEGVLLDILISMERETMFAFLGGTVPQIRNFILSRCPEDFAETLQDELDNQKTVNYDLYQLARERVLSKIRTLAQKGIIDLYEVNRILFPVKQEIQQGKRNIRFTQVN